MELLWTHTIKAACVCFGKHSWLEFGIFCGTGSRGKHRLISPSYVIRSALVRFPLQPAPEPVHMMVEEMVQPDPQWGGRDHTSTLMNALTLSSGSLRRCIHWTLLRSKLPLQAGRVCFAWLWSCEIVWRWKNKQAQHKISELTILVFSPVTRWKTGSRSERLALCLFWGLDRMRVCVFYMCRKQGFN